MGKFRKRATGRYEEYKRNQDIKFKYVRVVLGENEGTKDMSKEEAMVIAEEKGLDLVLISPGSNPPICKLIDYGQFLYQQKKKDNVKHKNNKKSEIKGIRLTFNIGIHDFEIKLKKAREFLEEKNFVKITLQFKGRELTHSQLGMDKIKEFIEKLKDVGKAEQDPTIQGRQVSLLLTPCKSKNN